jgi:HD superfamily phosphohydrolase
MMSGFQDALYGSVGFDDPIAELAGIPLVQRLRYVRLSNIDSIDLPGISNVSRYEHSLGVARLADLLGLQAKLSEFEKVMLTASAMLHDLAITASGHLVEEAFQYVGSDFNHEQRLAEIMSDAAPEEIGGVQRQVHEGREAGLEPWAKRVAASKADQLLKEITDHVSGRGTFGALISNGIDLDNIDNVFRLAFHMGLHTERSTPVQLAKAIVDFDRRTGEAIFLNSAVGDLATWRAVRHALYTRLMTAPHDFAGKLMILHATVQAFHAGKIDVVDWHLTDYRFLNKLLSSGVKEVHDAVQRWLVGELWDTTPLQWMEGKRPEYVEVLAFSRALSNDLGRTYFAYAIKDKRDRSLRIRFEDGSTETFGEDSALWLLGVGSPLRRAIRPEESKAIFEYAESYFGTRMAAPGPRPEVEAAQPWLL